MNEQLQNALAELLGKTIDGIDSSVAFMQSELPDVISQLLTWYAVKGFIYFILSILIIAAWLVVTKFALKKTSEWRNYDGVDIIFMYAMGGAPSVFVSGLLFNLDWLQIWIAPKIWLIEYSANLVK